MKFMSIFAAFTFIGLAFPSEATNSFYKEMLDNKPVIEQVYTERNKHLGLSKAEFKKALEKYYDYISEAVLNSDAAQKAALAASEALAQRKTNSPKANDSLKEYIKLQNIANLEQANILEIDITTLQRFREAAAYVEYLHQDSKKSK